MEYTINGKLTFEDYKNFITAALVHKKYRLFIFAACLLVLLYTAGERILTSPSVRTAIIEFLPIAFLIVFYLILYKIFLKRNYKSDRMFQDEITLTFREEGVLCQTERGSYNYTVEDFKSFIFSKKLIALYVSSRKALLIPRHFFTSEEEERKVERFIKEKYAKKAEN